MLLLSSFASSHNIVAFILFLSGKLFEERIAIQGEIFLHKHEIGRLNYYDNSSLEKNIHYH